MMKNKNLHISENNKKSIEIYKIIFEKYEETKINYSAYENIYGIFFHEIIIFCSSAFLNKNDPPLVEKSKLRFPFVNNQYLNTPELSFWEDKIRRKYIKNNPFSGFLKRKYLDILLINLKNLILRKNKIFLRQIHVSEIENDLLCLVKKGYTICFLKGHEKIFLPDLNKQILHLHDTLLFIFKSVLSIDGGKVVPPFLDRIVSYVKPQASPIKNSILITGSLTILENRISAINFKKNNGKIISYAHGTNSFLGRDEPIIGYGELSYVDYYVDFGEKNMDIFNTQYQKILTPSPNIFFRSNDMITKLITMRSNSISKKDRILYIPTSFSGSYRYGPFRDISDREYARWQETLLKLYPCIVYKSHPYSCSYTKRIFEARISNKILNENLIKIDIENNFDAVILDYFGTAHSIVAATSKPILYFNLGLRNMEQSTLSLFKKRVFWHDIQMDIPFEQQILDAIENFMKADADYDYDSFTYYDSISSRNVPIDQILDLD